jgi:hypothetical protein
MGSDIFNTLFKEQVDNFKYGFSKSSPKIFIDKDTSKIYHNGEFGYYRETVAKEFLRFFIPRDTDISTGFIITAKNNRSTQCDIILFNKTYAPLYRDDAKQTFFPIESVCGVGEIKSTLDRHGLFDALNKLAKIKSLSNDPDKKAPVKSTGNNDHPGNPYGDIFTFLICKKLDFNISNLPEEINNAYETGIADRYKHNLILSIDDGVIAYHGAEDGGILNHQFFHYPVWYNKPMKNRLISLTDSEYVHFEFFCNSLFMLATTKIIYYPEFQQYIGSFTGGINYDQK